VATDAVPSGPRAEPLFDAFLSLSGTLRWSDLAPATRHNLKRELLDYFGAAIAGRAAVGLPQWLRVLVDCGGTPDAYVLGGPRIPAHTAALCNGYLGHVLELDDTHDEAVLHAGAAAIPAALAAASRRGGVDGATFCEAVLLGIELTCRLGVGTRLNLVEGGWIYTALLGHFGAALAAGRILDPRPHTLRDALGIVYCLTSGNHASTREGATTKHVQPGIAAGNGVLAALMAGGGLDGVSQPLTGEDGLDRVYLHGRLDPARALRDLGRQWELDRLSFKPYPSCRFTHPAISAALELRRQLGDDANRIERVEALMGAQSHDVVGRDVAEKRSPTKRIEAQFSVFWTVACALEFGEVTPSQLLGEIPPSPRLARMISRITAGVVDAQTVRTIGSCTVRAHGPFGMREVTHEHAKGHPDHPLDDDELRAKFDANLRFAKVDRAVADRIASMIMDVDRLADVDELAAALAGAVR
jgi:2-methylcitrate dehydratase PrpD